MVLAQQSVLVIGSIRKQLLQGQIGLKSCHQYLYRRQNVNEWTSSKKNPFHLDFLHYFSRYYGDIFLNVIITFSPAETYGLKCFVGLGNSSKKREMKVVDCPEGKFYVCVKMFGGGMGDQIRRYCEAIPREVQD